MISNYSNHWYNQHTKNHKLKPILTYLNTLLSPACNWFIAGGSVANPDYFNDIDIYFTDEASFKHAAAAFRSITHMAVESPNAYTFSNVKLGAITCLSLFGTMLEYTFQLVTRQFTTIDNILEDFDISCSKLAMDPSGEVWKHHDYSDLMRIHHIHIGTFQRITKYYHEKNFTLDKPAFQQTLAQLHATRNDTLMDYYDNHEIKHVVKRCILQGPIHPIFLRPLIEYIETLPPRTRQLIYARHFWEYDGVRFLPTPDNHSIEYQRLYSLYIQRIPAMLNVFPEDYL